MKIYFFIKDVSLTGGTERVTVNLASLFYKKGHDVTVVSYYQGKTPITYSPIEGVKVVYLLETRCPDEGNRLKRLRLFIKAFKALKEYVRQERISEKDIIISQNFFSNALMWLSGNAYKVIGCEHFKYDLYSNLVSKIRCHVYSYLKCIVTLTEKDQKRFMEHLDANKTAAIANMVVVKDGVEPDIDSKDIICMGRLTPQKGFDILIDAMVIVAKKHPDWKVNIFGEGEDKDLLKKQIIKNGLQKHVILRGYSTNINAEFSKSAFFVLSSRYEGFPLALIEALGQGMPSVAFDCPEGPAQLLETGGGILVERENVTKLADAICYMIEHQEFRAECVEHRDYIRQHLSPEKIYETWVALFRRLGYAI